MKKILLIFCILSISLLSFAADLNPFAYGLKSEFNPSTLTLTVNFSLNAPAEYMKLAISDGTTDVWTKEYLASSYISGKVPKATYNEVIDVSEFEQGKEFTWRVDVRGAEVSSPTFVKNDVRLYAPTSVDIDNNPENPNFGTVFCVDGLNGAYQKSGYSNYLSYTDGAGLYLLNADGTARRMPFQGEKIRYGYNGSVVSLGDRPFFGNNGTNNLRGYNAFRVRVSDDGRIFVTSFSTNGHVLWEAKKECFSATTQEEWSANTGWNKIMTVDDSNTYMADTKRNCSHEDCGIYSLYQGNANTGAFIAGPNLGFDVKGSGDNLQLLMLAGCKQAIVWSTPAHYYCDEYDFKSSTKLWNTAPSRRIFAGHSDGIDIVNSQGVQVQYDKNGNVWVCQHRGVKTNTTLARVNRSLASTKKNNVEIGQVDHNESSHTYRRCGAIRFNEDFSQVAIASNANGNGAGFTVYPVDGTTGMPIWTQGTEVNTYSKTGVSLMDFAWDYAGNLYIAADAATNGERIAVYAMPHSAERVVSTPAASKYTFSVDCQAGEYHTVTIQSYPDDGGIITCTSGGSARTPGLLTVESCTELTVTAIPAEGHNFRNWTDDADNIVSTTPEYTFYVTKDIKLTANFEYATYSGLVWKNLFKNGKDIADVESAECSGRNERLWRLFQVDWNEEFSASKADQGYTKNTYEFDVAGYVTRDNSVAMFTQSSRPFRWLGKYMMNVVGDTIVNGKYWGIEGINIWGYYLYAFINRTNKVYNSQDQAMGSDSKVDFSKFPVAGQTNAWRPYWAEHACGLKETMTYDEYMPTIDTWRRPECPSGYITKHGTSTEIYPSDWYKWNTQPEDIYILAWRNGSPTAEEIVHHVYEPDMELHASYVKKNIDEEDNVDVNTNDASNNDVIKLMQNRNFVGLNPDTTVQPTHTLTVTRKLRAGMYNTICLPFGVDLTGLQQDHDLKNAEAWEFAGTTSDTYNESGDPVTVLNFNKVTTLEAGKPYFIKLKGNQDVTTDMTFSGVSSKPYVYPQSGGGLIFYPTINPTTIPAGALILVANDRLAVNTEEGEMLGLRGYFQIDETDPIFASEIKQRAAEGRVYLSFKKPVTSSVPIAPEAEQPRKPQVSKIMRDGKIYIIRDGVTYTITGARVR